jgi:hypothetical protein
MTDNPMTPPPELVQQWASTKDYYIAPWWVLNDVATHAAQWGADQQLAKDAEWLDHNALNEPHLRITPVGESLKEAMRPKPPSLKEQALAQLDLLTQRAYARNFAGFQADTIRRAIEALPND